MLIITGPGRSGTSVLALFCQRLGYHPGGQWYDCVSAGLEDERVVLINDALEAEIRHTGQTTHTLARYASQMRQLEQAVIKDPRFTYHPQILRAWHSVRADLKVVLTYRHPEHSLASRRRQARLLLHPHKRHANILRQDLADCLETLLELEIPFQMLLFPQFLDRYEAVERAFSELGLEIDGEQGRQAWASVVDRSKVHFPALEREPMSVGEVSGRSPFLRQRLVGLTQWLLHVLPSKHL